VFVLFERTGEVACPRSEFFKRVNEWCDGRFGQP
jgi:hypothetical protein